MVIIEKNCRFNCLARQIMRRSAKILILEGIIKKISYGRRDYESVDRKKLILGYVPKNYEKKEFQAVKS